MTVARLFGRKTFVAQNHLGLAAALAESESDDGLVPRHPLRMCRLPGPGENQSFGADDLAISAGDDRSIAAVGAAHMDAVAAAHFRVRFQDLSPDVSWTYPFADLRGIEPGIEHALARRIEAARDHQCKIGLSAGHGFSVLHGFVLSLWGRAARRKI